MTVGGSDISGDDDLCAGILNWHRLISFDGVEGSRREEDRGGIMSQELNLGMRWSGWD